MLDYLLSGISLQEESFFFSFCLEKQAAASFGPQSVECPLLTDTIAERHDILLASGGIRQPVTTQHQRQSAAVHEQGQEWREC